MRRYLVLLLLLVVTGACASPRTTSVSMGDGSVSVPGEPPTDGGGGAAAGTCLEGTPDCNDTPDTDMGGGGDAMNDDQLRKTARDLLGLPENEVPDDVRIGRRGDEQFALTEDYRPGRMTVELDENDKGVLRVTVVTVELVEGPETFRAE